ncbi:precorrin-2 dehydrogenase/sirohydrochlorin ferrochelatase [Psychrobacillus insolitus]|uniref:precorrin-2 dehydrogenase n=1 Tax=Psychrobacillus insolitus TaxID=1461 RepID=A0A2W7MI42_9BACI|nr:NAD(P)-dependent oxidoreductase [Psychrobacillus insolitus]PZX02431.1 precorrin-2 dehydrogenase/sirohydrochlorin ferrochelatase [Psychrobacillus insolitus]
MQPLVINLTDKKVVIAGGGRIAARKARVLGAEQANITFIAPVFSEEVLELCIDKEYKIVQRKVMVADFKEAFLVILATNDREANRILANSLPPSQLVCVVDESGEGNVTFPATVRRGHLQVAVTSNGASPKLTRKLKKELERQFDESWVPYTAFLNKCREKIKQLPITFEEKNERLWELLDTRYLHDNNAQKLKWDELDSYKNKSLLTKQST